MRVVRAQRRVNGDHPRSSRHILYKDGATLLLHQHLLHRASFVIPCTGASCTDPSFSISYIVSPSVVSSWLTTVGGKEPEGTMVGSPVLTTIDATRVRCGGDARHGADR
jgi:hypothetical protein